MTPERRSQQVHLVLRIAQYEALLAESKRTGTPMAELVRRAIDAKYPTGQVAA